MTNLEELETRLLSSPTARARFLADTMELLEKNGVDVTGALGDVISSLDLTNGVSFLGGLAASSIVITRTSTGRDASNIGISRTIEPGGNAASTFVITRTSTGREPGSIDPGNIADTVVITRTSTGRTGVDPGNVASTLVITRTSTGRLGDIANQLGILANELQQEALHIDDSEKQS